MTSTMSTSLPPPPYLGHKRSRVRLTALGPKSNVSEDSSVGIISEDMARARRLMKNDGDAHGADTLGLDTSRSDSTIPLRSGPSDLRKLPGPLNNKSSDAVVPTYNRAPLKPPPRRPPPPPPSVSTSSSPVSSWSPDRLTSPSKHLTTFVVRDRIEPPIHPATNGSGIDDLFSADRVNPVGSGSTSTPTPGYRQLRSTPAFPERNSPQSSAPEPKSVKPTKGGRSRSDVYKFEYFSSSRGGARTFTMDSADASALGLISDPSVDGEVTINRDAARQYRLMRIARKAEKKSQQHLRDLAKGQSPSGTKTRESIRSTTSSTTTTTMASTTGSMTSSSSLSALSTLGSSKALPLPTSHSLSDIALGNDLDDWAPQPLRYPKLDKKIARLSQVSTYTHMSSSSGSKRRHKSSKSPSSACPPLPPTPTSARSTRSAASSSYHTAHSHAPTDAIPPSPSRPPRKGSAVEDLREALERATLALAASPHKTLPPTRRASIKSSKDSHRQSNSSITSTLFTAERASSMSTSHSLVSLSNTSSSGESRAPMTPSSSERKFSIDRRDHQSPSKTLPSDCSLPERPPSIFGLSAFPFPPTSIPSSSSSLHKAKSLPSLPPLEEDTKPSQPPTEPEPLPNIEFGGHERWESNLTAILDWPMKHMRNESGFSFILDFPIPPSRPTLEVVIADTDSPEKEERKLVFESPEVVKKRLSMSPTSPDEDEDEVALDTPKEEEETPRPRSSAILESVPMPVPIPMVEEPTLLPYLKQSMPEPIVEVTKEEEAESDLDLSGSLVDVALRTNIISPNSRLAKTASMYSSPSRPSSSSGSATPRSASTPVSSSLSTRSSARSSSATLRPLSLASRHNGEGWSGSESEEEEFVSAIRSIALRRLSTPRLKRLPSLLPRSPRSNGKGSRASSASLSPLGPGLGSGALDSRRLSSSSLASARSAPVPHTGRMSMSSQTSPRTPTGPSRGDNEKEYNRLSTQSHVSAVSNSTTSESDTALLTPCHPHSHSSASSCVSSTSPSIHTADLPDPPTSAETESSTFTDTPKSTAEAGGIGVSTSPNRRMSSGSLVPSLPRPTRKVVGWGMPEILIDEEWSSGDEYHQRDTWSSEDELHLEEEMKRLGLRQNEEEQDDLDWLMSQDLD